MNIYHAQIIIIFSIETTMVSHLFPYSSFNTIFYSFLLYCFLLVFVCKPSAENGIQHQFGFFHSFLLDKTWEFWCLSLPECNNHLTFFPIPSGVLFFCVITRKNNNLLMHAFNGQRIPHNNLNLDRTSLIFSSFYAAVVLRIACGMQCACRLVRIQRRHLR